MADAAPRRALFEALVDAAALHGRRTRIIEDLRRQVNTYGDLLKGSLALGRLTARFTEPGERVGVLLPNLGATVCLVFGLASRGRVAAMLNYSSGVEALRIACVAASLRTVITSRAFIQSAQARAPAGRRRRLPHRLPGGSARVADAGRQAVDCRQPCCGRARRCRRRIPHHRPIVLFTSGSEARPKGVVVLTHDTMLGVMAQLRAVIDFGPDDKYLNALPMYHTFGLIACTLMPLLTGTRLYLYTNPLHYKVIPELAYTRDCTYIFGTSTFLGNYARQAHPYDFYRIRFVICRR